MTMIHHRVVPGLPIPGGSQGGIVLVGRASHSPLLRNRGKCESELALAQVGSSCACRRHSRAACLPVAATSPLHICTGGSRCLGGAARLLHQLGLSFFFLRKIIWASYADKLPHGFRPTTQRPEAHLPAQLHVTQRASPPAPPHSQYGPAPPESSLRILANGRKGIMVT